MKKFLVLLLTLMLLCSASLAEIITLDHFTLDIDLDMPGKLVERADSEVFLFLYPDFDENALFHNNINFIWSNETFDVYSVNIEEAARQSIDEAIVQFKDYNIAASNAELLIAEIDEIDGLNAMGWIYSLDMDYTGAGTDLVTTLYYVQFTVPIQGIGTYTITCTADSREGLASHLDLLNTLKWTY